VIRSEVMRSEVMRRQEVRRQVIRSEAIRSEAIRREIEIPWFQGLVAPIRRLYVSCNFLISES